MIQHNGLKKRGVFLEKQKKRAELFLKIRKTVDGKKNCFKWAKDSIQACGLNKKIDKIQLVEFFGWGSWIRTNEVTESEEDKTIQKTPQK